MNRFWSKVNKEAPNGCWEWTAGRDRGGYGRFFLEGRCQGAHRVAWMIAFGAIPDDLHVLHTCDNPACVRSEHLFLGTNQDNIDDKMAKGRWGGGVPELSADLERYVHSMLTE